ncbi:MAG: MMPL family transporter [Burkholderiales bacterium]
MAAALWILRGTSFSGDISAFLPSKPSEAQKILVEQLQDGVVSRILLLAIEGGNESERADASRAFLGQLASLPSLAYVHNGDENRMGPERDYLLHNRYLLSDAVTPQHFSKQALRNALENNLSMLNSPLGMLVKHILPEDPTGEFIYLIEQFEGESRPAQRDGLWFSRDGKRALLIAQTKAPGFDIDAQEQIQRDIRLRFAQVGAGKTINLLVSGPGIFAVNTRDAIRSDAQKLSIIATILIATLLLWVYRSPRILLLGILPVGSGVLVGIAAVSLAYGSVHGITLGFGVTLIGEAVDYAIYLFTQQTREHKSTETLDRIWPTLRLGVLLSVAGFSAMLFSGFPGLGQLGLFSIAGIVTALAVTRWVLPNFLPHGFSAEISPALQRRLLGSLAYAGKLKPLVWGAVALALGTVVWQRAALWNDDLGDLSPVPVADKQLDESLRNDIGAPDVGMLLTARAVDQEAALQLSEKLSAALRPLVQNGVLTGFDAPSRYLPSKVSQEARLASLPDTPVLRANLDAALEGMPFQSGLFQPFLNQIEASRSAPLLDRDALAGTAFAIKVDGLLVMRRDSALALLPLRGLKDADRLRQTIVDLKTPGVSLIDLKYESDQLYGSYRHQALLNALWGTLAIAVLLLVSLRSVGRAYRVLAPLLAAVVVTVALLLVTGYALSIFHLVALLLVIGVGSNYSLFFDNENFARGTPERTLASLVLCNISTIIGFGILGFSSAPVLAAIGSTVACGAFLSLLFAAILTPDRSDSAQKTSASVV